MIRTSDSVIKGLAINRFLDNGISGSGATGNRVEGNFVGTNASGTKDLGNSVRSNRIFANGELGIDLVGNGVTGNDPDDGDTGPNNLQNFLVITSVTQSSLPFNPTSISGTLDSVPSTSTRTQNFTIQCFAAPDPPTVPW